MQKYMHIMELSLASAQGGREIFVNEVGNMSPIEDATCLKAVRDFAEGGRVIHLFNLFIGQVSIPLNSPNCGGPEGAYEGRAQKSG